MSGAVVTIPNGISLVRLLMVPVFVWLLFGADNPAGAGWLFGVLAATDWIDGYLARRLNQVSEVGKFLDPLADRLAVAAAVIGGLISGDLPRWLAVAIIVREVMVAIGALVVGVKAGSKLEVRYLGKLATSLVYMSVAWFFIGYGTPYDPLVWAAWITGLPGLVLYYLVGFEYFGDARRLVQSEN